MMILHLFFQYAAIVPLYQLVIWAEAWYLRRVRREVYPRRMTQVSSLTGVGYLVNLFACHALFAPVYAWVWRHRLLDIPMRGVAPYVGLFLGMEFAFYWYHRGAHRVRAFWLSHSVHHTSPVMNFAAALRLPWNGEVYTAFTLFMPLIWLGFTPYATLTMLNLNLFYQFWTHTRLGGEMKLLGWVFNTPSHHRVHHARNPIYLDKNYGSVLIVFDRLFGTFQAELSHVPCDYGLLGGDDTESRPWMLGLGPFLAIGRDMREAGSWGDRLRYAVKPPGWRHDGRGLTSDDLRARAGTGEPVAIAQPHEADASGSAA